MKGSRFFSALSQVCGNGRVCLAVFKQLLFVSIILLLPTIVMAAPSPEGTVTELVTKLKATGNPEVVLDFVQWDEAFKGFPANALTQIKVKNGAELKEYMRGLLKDPGKMVREQFEKTKANIPPEKLAQITPQIEVLVNKIETQFKEMKEKLLRTEYKVGATEMTGADRALVHLTTTVDGKSREDSVQLVKAGSEWLLSSVQFVQGAKGPNGAGPAGAAPSSGGPSKKAPEKGIGKAPVSEGAPAVESSSEGTAD